MTHSDDTDQCVSCVTHHGGPGLQRNEHVEVTIGLSRRMSLAIVLIVLMVVAVLVAVLIRMQIVRNDLARRAGQLTDTALTTISAVVTVLLLVMRGPQLNAIKVGDEDGPLAVLLHGFPECWYSWRHQIPLLVRRGFCVMVPDLRGYNLSDKPNGISNYRVERLVEDVCDIIRSTGRDRAALLVGHDWGGVVAWRVAIERPQFVERLVIMNAPHPVSFARALRTREQRRRSWYIFFFRLPWVPETLLTLAPLFTALFFFHRCASRKDAFNEFDVELFASAMVQPGAMRCMINWYRAALQSMRRRRSPGESGGRLSARIDIPTQVIWGMNDVALSRSLTEGLDEWVSDLRLVRIPRCGHWVQNEAPEETNEALEQFLHC